VPGDDPPEDVHFALKKKMRMDQRAARLALSEDTPAEGRPFLCHVWPGIPLGELTTTPVGSEGESGIGGSAGEEGRGEASTTMSSNVTRSHTGVIMARDKVYQAYKSYFRERVAQVARSCDAALDEERQWKVLWEKLVSACKVTGTA
ncbi:MAG: hypothetical protein SGPRY_014162, partial [Prymnesium sp.]